MFTRLLVALLLVLLANAGIQAASGAAPGQAPAAAQPTVAVSDPNAVALASRALQSLAGGTALNDITLQGSATYIAGSDEETGTATLVARGNAQSVVTLNLTGGQRQEVRNGVAGVWVGSDGTPHAMATHNCWTDANWFFPGLSLQALANDPQVSISYVGLETLDGTALHHLRLSRTVLGQTPQMTTDIQRLSAFDLYLDPRTLLPLVAEFNAHPDDDFNLTIPVEIQFADYRPVNGVRVPFRIRKLLQGTLTLDLTVANAAVNSGVPPTLFSISAVPTGGAQ
ncbi:MAG: hypothetical protein LAO04_16915 [Acidobacteriia bacterium]|nr:hypothetical protein [Terriglobia bacterium]